MTKRIDVFEAANTFTRDITLDRQIEMGINDWRAECGVAVAFGHSRQEAIANLSRVTPHVIGAGS
jgi:hypothetical protein